MLVAHRSLILSLVIALLWPWAAASACHAAGSVKAPQGCCTERCCCDETSPCGCEVDEAPAAPQESAPSLPDATRASFELALLATPEMAFDLILGHPTRAAHSAHPVFRSASEGRAILLRACRLRH